MHESRIDKLLKEIGNENISAPDELVESTIVKMKRVDGTDIIIVSAVILNLLSFIAAVFFILFSKYGLPIKLMVYAAVSMIINLSILIAYMLKAQSLSFDSEQDVSL